MVTRKARSISFTRDVINDDSDVISDDDDVISDYGDVISCVAFSPNSASCHTWPRRWTVL